VGHEQGVAGATTPGSASDSSAAKARRWPAKSTTASPTGTSEGDDGTNGERKACSTATAVSSGSDCLARPRWMSPESS
jgi:hypothetical protein